MTAFTWAIRLIIFFLLVVFSLQNAEPVNLHLLPGQVWQAPLVIVLLAFFACGALLGVLSLLGVIYRQRREISRFKHAAAKPQETEVIVVPPAL